MQIMPTGGSWINPAALNQQALNESKHTGPTANKSPSPDAVDKLEHSEKSGDRDANERYDGPQNQQHHSSGQQSTPDQAASMLSLPAIDDLPTPTLDLLG
jgi:hypothetical protein